MVAGFTTLLAETLNQSCSETFGDRERWPGLPPGEIGYDQIALIGFSGVRHRGQVGVAVPPETARRLGPVGEGGGGLLVSDHVGETSNLLFGSIKARLARFGIEIHCGTPLVLREASLSMKPAAAVGPVIRCALTVETAAGRMLAWIDMSIPEDLDAQPALLETYEEPPGSGELLLFDVSSSPAPARAVSETRKAQTPDSGTPVVLFVDDEEANRVVFMSTLGRQFETILASSGSEALALLQERRVDVLVTDNRMPKMTGVELCEHVRARHPDVQRVLVTAYSDLNTVSEAINRGGVSRYLTKPWKPAEVAAAIRDAATAARASWIGRELQTAMAEQERLSALSAARNQVLHDLANVTSLVTTCCSALEGVTRGSGRHLPEADATALASEVGELRVAVNALRALHTRVRALNRHSEPDPSSNDLEPVLQAVMALSRVWLPASARIEIHCPPGTTAWCDRTDLGRILVNLVTNAAQAIVGAGTRDGLVRIEAERADDQVRFVVSDNGPGIPAASRTKIFEPDFTTRREAGFTGLGLAICRQLALDNGGTLALVDAARGATFVLTMPAVAPSNAR